MAYIIEFICIKAFGFERFEHRGMESWPLLMRKGDTWFIFFAPSWREHHQRGVQLVAILFIIALLRFWLVSYGQEFPFPLPFERLLFGTLPRVITTLVFAYLSASFTFLSKYMLVVPGLLRYSIVRTIDFESPQELGVVAKKDSSDERDWHLLVQWGIDGAYQKHILTIREGRIANRATAARVGLLVALNNGHIANY